MPVFLRWLLRLGPTNPITMRVVQVGSRRSRHLYIRSAYLGLLIVVLLWLLVLRTHAQSLSYRELAAAGAESFIWIAYLQIILICVLAPVFMAGAIAQEASPRTWDILLTTPLTAPQIVLGNLFGRLFFILALLFASLPLFAITQFFGGVPGSSIFASYLIAACAALLVGSIAITLAVSRLAGKRAVFAFYVAVVSYLAVTGAIDFWLGGAAQIRGVSYMTALNPFLALQALLNPSSYITAPDGSTSGLASWFLEHPVKTWCVGSSLVSLVLMAASTLTVRTGGLTGIGESGTPWYRRMFGLGAAGAEHRPPRHVGKNPIAWREAAARNATMGRIAARWAFVALGGLFGVALVALFASGRFNADDFRLALMSTVWGELAVIVLVAINMAATAVSREREDGTLDLLLTTPITPSSYLTGKLRGLIAYLLPMLAVPLGTLLIAGAYAGVGQLAGWGSVTVPSTAGTSKFTAPVVLPEAGLLATIVVLPFIALCVMVGLQWSLKSKGTIGSVVATVGVVGVIAGIVGLCAWQAAADVPHVGPVLAGFSPASLVFALVRPEIGMMETIVQIQLGGARVALFIGCVIAAVVHIAAVYGIHANMVRTFDMTVRRLAGMK